MYTDGLKLRQCTLKSFHVISVLPRRLVGKYFHVIWCGSLRAGRGAHEHCQAFTVYLFGGQGGRVVMEAQLQRVPGRRFVHVRCVVGIDRAGGDCDISKRQTKKDKETVERVKRVKQVNEETSFKAAGLSKYTNNNLPPIIACE